MAERRRRRTTQRARDRLRLRLAGEIEALARLEAGGSPGRPLSVDSVAVIEIRATAAPCLLCEGPLRLVAHRAEVIDGARLRVADVACAMCGVERAIYFRLEEPLIN